MPHQSHYRNVHYVYRVTDERTGDFYIGVRSCDSDPAEDTNYCGSGRWPKAMAFDGVPLTKSVLATFPDRLSAEEAETLLIDMNLLDGRCRNDVRTASARFKARHCHYRGAARQLVFEGSIE